ncbi:MAG: sulfur carrier protein ThiS adenylyltransferase ThiF [Deltaproteobacteria bacterium]|nr:sulfur carrier protein ThiS adenylyltransferase ThiF [Deltaproteobacteria bacterium]
MRVRANGVDLDVARGATLGSVAEARKPGADLLIRNGFPSPPDTPLSEGDEVVVIRRGEVPPPEELEALLVARHTPGVHRAAKAARVGVAGLGGLGSQVAIALARTGVGSLVLADFDVVEPSNLNRQQYFVDQIGQPKTAALAVTLARINPYLTIETHCVRLTPDNIPSLFAGCRVLVEAFDRADQKAMLVETALAKLPETWVVAASGVAGYEPSDTIRCHRLGSRLFVVGDLEVAAGPGTGLMAPRVGVAAHAQANLTLRIVLGAEV